jgi:hypothetical protein
MSKVRQPASVRGRAIFVWAIAGMACACSSASAPQDERIGRAQSRVTGSEDDLDLPEENVVS